MPHEIFVSHSTKDKVAADAVVAHLEQDGIKCWYSPRDIPAGEHWPTAITGALHAARAVVLVFSENANQSDHVGREVDLALKREIPVVPVRIDHVVAQGELEYFLATAHWMDATSPPFDRHCDELANRLRSLLNKPLLPIAPEVAPSRFASRRLRLILLSLGIAVAALGIAMVVRHGMPKSSAQSPTDAATALGIQMPETLSPTDGELVVGPILQYIWKDQNSSRSNTWYEIERGTTNGKSNVDRLMRRSFNETSLNGSIRWRVRAGRTEQSKDLYSEWTPWQNTVHYQDALAKIVATRSVCIALAEEDGTFIKIENGVASGFEIEFIRTVLNRYLKTQGIDDPVQINYRILPWGDPLFTSLNKPTSDLVGSGISITGERARKYHVVFTDPLVEYPPAFLFLEGSSFDAHKLDNTTIGGAAQTTDFDLAQRLASIRPGVNTKSFEGSDTNLQMVHALVDGGLDAAIVDFPYALALKELYAAQGIHLASCPIDNSVLPAAPVEHIGFMTRPLDTRLRGLLNAAIHSNDGTVAELLQQQHLLGVTPGKSTN